MYKNSRDLSILTQIILYNDNLILIMRGETDMKHSKVLIDFKTMEINKPVTINIECDSTVKINDVSFKENIVSKIEFIKYQFEDGCNLFIHVYAGNLCLTTTIIKENYIVETDKTSGYLNYYVRKAMSYDYEK